MNEQENRVLECVDSLEREMVDLACDLVRTNTVNPYSGDEPTGSEAEGQDRLKTALQPYGPFIEMFEPPADIYERMEIIGPQGRNFRDRPNLVAVWEFGEGGPTLILNDHMDTVGVSGMTIPPFSGEIRDGKIWGRGTSDSKGCLVAAVWAAAALSRCADGLRGRLILESVVDEECNGSGAGTLACCQRGYGGDAAVVVDGAGLSVVFGGGGVVTVDIRVFGREGHASGEEGVNAIDKACVVKQGIDAFKALRMQQAPGYPVNLGVFQAGSVPAVVPGEARLSVNICYTYDESVRSREAGFHHEGGQVYESFSASLRASESRDPWLVEHPSELTWVKDLIPFSSSPDHWLVKDLAASHGSLCGAAPTLETWVTWTDASYLLARAQTPVVLYGPAAKGVAHGPAEYIAIDDMKTAARVIAVFGTRFFRRSA